MLCVNVIRNMLTRLAMSVRMVIFLMIVFQQVAVVCNIAILMVFVREIIRILVVSAMVYGRGKIAVYVLALVISVILQKNNVNKIVVTMCPHVTCIVKAPNTHTYVLVILDFLGHNANKLKNNAHPFFAIIMVSV